MSQTDILFFVEDPGAANYLANIPEILKQRGKKIKFWITGHAIDYLSNLEVQIVDTNFPSNFKDLFQTDPPRLLVTGTSENPETAGFVLIHLAQKQGIPSIAVIDAIGNAEYRFRGLTNNPLAHVPDWLLLPDQWTKKGFKKIGFPSDKMKICGHPHFDYIRQVAEQLKKIDKKTIQTKLWPNKMHEQKVVVFVAEVSTGLNPSQFQRSDEYTLIGTGKYSGRTEIVLEEFLIAIQTIQPKPYLILRLHPKNEIEEFAFCINEFDEVSSGEPIYEILYASDLVVGMSSMVLLEAELMEIPCISILPREVEKNWLPTIIEGITPCAVSREKIKSLLHTFLGATTNYCPPKKKTVFPLNSTKMVVEQILEIDKVSQRNI